MDSNISDSVKSRHIISAALLVVRYFVKSVRPFLKTKHRLLRRPSRCADVSTITVLLPKTEHTSYQSNDGMSLCAWMEGETALCMPVDINIDGKRICADHQRLGQVYGWTEQVCGEPMPEWPALLQ